MSSMETIGKQNYANTQITPVSSGTSCLFVASKHALSPPSTPDREGILRGGITQRLKSPFVEFSASADSDMPSVASFPDKDIDNT